MNYINNLGEFDSLADVWKEYPHGGKEGDYVVINGVNVAWNKYTTNWGADTGMPDVNNEVNGDFLVKRDLRVGGEIINKDLKWIKEATVLNKGYFKTVDDLKRSYPAATAGSKAYVGSDYPYAIYLWDATTSTWMDSGETGGEESVNLGDYYTKEETDAKVAELDKNFADLREAYISIVDGNLIVVNTDEKTIHLPIMSISGVGVGPQYTTEQTLDTSSNQYTQFILFDITNRQFLIENPTNINNYANYLFVGAFRNSSGYVNLPNVRAFLLNGSEIKNRITDDELLQLKYAGDEWFVFPDKYVRCNTGVITSTSNPSAVTDYLPLDGIEKIRVKGRSSDIVALCAFYDENKNVISTICGYAYNDVWVEITPSDIPVGAKYIVFTGDGATSKLFFVTLKQMIDSLGKRVDAIPEDLTPHLNEIDGQLDEIDKEIHGGYQLKESYPRQSSALTIVENNLTPEALYQIKIVSAGQWTHFGFAKDAEGKNTTFIFSKSYSAEGAGPHFHNFYAPPTDEYPYIAYQIMSSGTSLEIYNVITGLEQEIDALKQNQTVKSIKVLHFGNSYTLDAVAYIQQLMAELLPNCKITIGVIYNAGATLQRYNDSLIPDNMVEKYYLWKDGVYSVNSNTTIASILESEDWDVVTFQQQSDNSKDYSTYQPYLRNIIKSIFDMVQNPVEFAFLLTTPEYRGYNLSVESFEGQASAAKNVLEETACLNIVPLGTAIQNLRTIPSFLTYGDNAASPEGGGMMNQPSGGADHLQTGIGMLAEGYVYILWLMNMLGLPMKLYGSSYRPIEGDAKVPHGEMQGITDENCRLAQIAAYHAIKNPTLITDMSNG